MTITTEELTRLVEAATLGPWAAKRAPHGPVDVFDTAGHDVVTIYGGGDRQMPNARLIAAAPDLAREVLELRAERDAMRAAADAMVEAMRDMINGYEEYEFSPDGTPVLRALDKQSPWIQRATVAITAYHADKAK